MYSLLTTMIRARVDNELLPLANYCRLTLQLLLIVQDLTHTKIPVKSNNLMDIKLYIYVTAAVSGTEYSDK